MKTKSVFLAVTAFFIFSGISTAQNFQVDQSLVNAAIEAVHNHSNKVGGTGGSISGKDTASMKGSPSHGLNPQMDFSTTMANETFRDREPGDGGDTPWSYSSVMNQFSTSDANGMKVKYSGEQKHDNAAEFNHANGSAKAENSINLKYDYKNNGDLYAGNSTNSLTSTWGGEIQFDWGMAMHTGAESLVEGYVWSTPDTGKTSMSVRQSLQSEAVATQQNSTVKARGSINQTSKFCSGKSEDSFKTPALKVETGAWTFGGGGTYDTGASVKVYTNAETKQ